MNKSKLFSIKNIIIIIVIIMALIAGILIVFLINQNDNSGGAKKTRTSITGLPTDIPKDISSLIEAGLYDTIALNLPDDETPPKSGAIIREGSLQESFDESENLHYGDFITDIDSIKQSFSIYYEWTNDKNNAYMSGYPVIITCVERTERIYNTTSCIDAYHQADPVIDSFAEKYLPRVTKTATGIDYNIIKDYSDTKPVIAVVSYTCKGDKNAEEVKNDSETWIKSTDTKINSSDIIQKNYCDGMMNDFPPVVKINRK